MFHATKILLFSKNQSCKSHFFKVKLQHIRYHRYGLCLNYIQRYSYSLFLLYTNASNVTTASGIIMNLSNNIKSSIGRYIKSPNL